jgi:Ca2+-binding RTX toxin-like protein
MLSDQAGRLIESASLTFEATGGLFGASSQGIDWDVFLGIGSLDGPLRAPFSIGGPVTTWLPFVGKTEVLRAKLFGEISTRIGLEARLDISPGETRARMPFDVGFSFPDAATLAANPSFRLEGSGVYTDDPLAGFETNWPYLAFNLAAVFEMAVLAKLQMGVLGNNTTRKLLDFDVASLFPLVGIDTRDRTEKANRTERLFGLDLGEIAELNGTFTPDPDEEEGPLLDLNLGDRYSFTFDLDGVDFFKSAEKESEREDTKARTEDDARDETDPAAEKKPKNEKQKASILDQFDNGNLAQLDLQLPRIELDGKGSDRDLPATGRVTYSDRTLTAEEAAALEVLRDRDGAMPEGVQDPRNNELARLNIDLDNILAEIVKGTLAGPALQKVPGFEGRIDLPISLGGFDAGAYFDYNLFDADLNLILPVRQAVSVETQPLRTRLSFSRADADGVPIDDDGAQTAFFIEARTPRYSVYFNEGAAFWNESVADLLLQAAAQSARAAEDVALFADLDGRRIPGAFTGQTGGVAGTIASSTDGGATWIELTTFPEETEWLARSRPVVGVEQRLEDLRPRDGAIFRYVVTDDDTTGTMVDTGGGIMRRRIDLATAVGSVPLAFHDLLGEGGVFDLRIDAVTAPISTTGFVEGVPSLDLVFPGIPNGSVWVDVEHEARALVDNRTTLDFDMNVALSALEFAFGAYVRAFGGRFGIDFAFGPLWEKVYPILSTTLAALYDDSFEISQRDFIAAPIGEVDFAAETPPATQDRWGFAIGKGGETVALVTASTGGDDVLDAAAIMGRAPGQTPVTDAAANGGAGTDTLTFARLAAVQTVYADLARGAAFLGWTTGDFEAFVAVMEGTNAIELTGAGARRAGSVTLDPAVETAGLAFSTDFLFLRDTLSGEIPRPAVIGAPFVDDPTGRGLAFVIRTGAGGEPTATYGLPPADTPSIAVVYSESDGGLRILRDGNRDAPLATLSLDGLFPVDGDSTRRMWIDYAGGVLEVRVAADGTRPEAPSLSATLDLAALLGPQVRFGIAASNGGLALSNSNIINDWTLSVPGGPDLRTALQTAFENYTLAGDARNESFTREVIVRDRGRLFVEAVENVTGGRSADILRGDAADNRLDGGEGDDTLEGRDGFDTLLGGPGSDVLDLGGPGAGEGREEALGGDGNDRVLAGAAPGRYDGGTGAPVGADALIPVDLDVIDYRHAPAGLLIDLATGERTGPWVGGHELANFEGIAGSAFGDTLRGDAGRSYLEGGGGGDLLVGSPLGEGLGRGARLDLPGGPDRLYGFAGDDTLVGGPGADMLDGGEGRDLVDYGADPVSVFVDMADAITVDAERFAPLLVPAGTAPTDYARIDGRGWRGWAQGDKLRDVEDLRGSAFDDILLGDAKPNRIEGGDGDDRLAGRFGEDTLLGGDGDDILWSRSAAIIAQGSYAPVERTPFDPGFETTGPMSLAGFAPVPTVDRLDGGDGRDLAILQWTPGFEIVQPNELVSNYYADLDPSFVSRRAYELRYAAPWLGQRLVASLGDGAAWVETFATAEDRTLQVTGARLSPDDPWTALEGLDSVTFFERVGAGSRVGLPLRQEFGDWFADAPTALVFDAVVRSDVAVLTEVEGLVTRDTPDFLIGTADAEALHSGGGADLIFAGAGDDVLSFGPGQPPEQIFSFPGRGYAALAALEARLGDAGAAASPVRDPSAADQLVTNAVFKQTVILGGAGSGPDRIDIDPFDPIGELPLGAPPAAPAAQAAVDALVAAYLAGSRDAAALDALAAALAAEDARLAAYAVLDGGAGRNTLDLRFDRGLDFLNRPGDLAAMVDLAAVATRFRVLPGFALPFTETDTPHPDASDTPDPAAYAWQALPAFTAAASVGEARFLTPALEESGPVTTETSRPVPVLPAEVRPALLFGISNVIGTAFADRLFGDDTDNVIEGGAGTAVRRLAPEQGEANAVIATYADWLDGRGGFDTLSYANAPGGVTLVIGQQADGATALVETAGDAAGDLFTGFEAVRGSELRDRLGFTGATLPAATLNAYYARNAIAVVDAGGGNDVLLAARAGVLFDGGDGDDIFAINRDPDPGSLASPDRNGAWLAVTGRPVPGGGPMVMAVEGGAGVDIARLSGQGLAGLALDGAVLRVTETVDESLVPALDDPTQATLVTALTGVDYVEIGHGATARTLALVNLDPVIEAPRTLSLPEDPWSVRRIFAESGPGSPRPGQTATVEALSPAGTFALGGPGGPVPLALGQTLDADALSRLVFVPCQQFGFPLDAAGDGPPVLQGAELGLSFRQDGGEPQPRTIRIEPGDLDGAALGIAPPSDIAHEASTVVAADRSARDNTGRPTQDRVRLFDVAGLDSLEARLAVAQAQLAQAEANLARTQLLFDRGVVSAATLTLARNQATAARNARDEAAEVLAGASDPTADLPRAEAYTVTEVTEGGTLWLADSPRGTPVLVEAVVPGTVLARENLTRLVFVKDGGSIDEDDAVRLAPVEALEITVTAVPDSGFVFSPVLSLGLDPVTLGLNPAAAAPVTLLEAPADGTLFLRGPDGARIPVAAGETLFAAQLSALSFEAGIARQATEAEPAVLAETLAALNRPTLDIVAAPGEPPRADGSGAAPIPADPTGLVLQLDLGRPAPAPVTGVTLDMGVAGVTEVLAYAGAITFRGAPLDWREWRREDGGNGHFYAIGSAGPTSSSFDAYFAAISGEAAASRPFDLASIGSAAENDFVFGLFADDPTMAQGTGSVRSGPALGGAFFEIDPSLPNDTSPRQWGWYDGSPWEFTAWRENEPNNVGGREWYLHYAIVVENEAERLFKPLWNDTTRTFGSPGWILEAPAVATRHNDAISGTASADLIRAGAGDDLLRGGEGDDTLAGEAGADTLEGGAGDDSLTGGEGNDLFVMTRDGGFDTVTDFDVPAGGTVRDRIDVSALDLRALGVLRITQPSATEIAIHAGGQTLLLQGMESVDPAVFTDARLYVGAPRFIGTVMPEAGALALSVGDTLLPDELAALRYRAAADTTGDAGTFAYEVRDPWALPEGIAGLDDPRAPGEDGIAAGSVSIALVALNDAPRAADRAHHFTVGAPLDGRVPELTLTATDPEGDAVTFLLVEGPQFGTLAFDVDGGFFYTPDAAPGPGYEGLDRFRYAVTDGTATSAPYTVQLEAVDPVSADAREDTAVDGYFRIGGRSANDRLTGLAENNRIEAGPGDDTIEGGGGDNLIDAGSGDDRVMPGGGTDDVTTGLGDDLVEGTLAALDGTRIRDLAPGDGIRIAGLSPAGLSLLQAPGEDGALAVTLRGGGTAALTLDGLGGEIPGPALGANGPAAVGLRLDPAPGGAVLRRADAPFAGTALTPLADRLRATGEALLADGGTGDDVIAGGGGGSVLHGGPGADLLVGGAGADVLAGGPGGDNLAGGAGPDRFAFAAADFTGAPVFDVITDFEPDSDVLALAGFAGLAGPDDLTVETLPGGLLLRLPGGGGIVLAGIAGPIAAADLDFADAARVSGAPVAAGVLRLGDGADRLVLRGAEGREVLAGGGNDTVAGAAGPDTLRGGEGADRLLGGAGDDLLDGGAGSDSLTGGAGADVFAFAAAGGGTGLTADLIEDFASGQDRVRLTGFAGLSDPDDIVYTSFGGALAIDLGADRLVVFRSLAAGTTLDDGDFLFA